MIEGKRRYNIVNIGTMITVYNVIKENSVANRCELSLREIAAKAGFSHSTAHRAIQRLAAEGYIEVLPAERPNIPDTIVIKREIDFANLALQVGAKLDEVCNELNTMRSLLPSLLSIDPIARQKAELFDVLKSSITSVNKLPNDMLVLTIDATKLPPRLADLFKDK